MIRGTTPTHIFTLSGITLDLIDDLIITYEQGRKDVFERKASEGGIEVYEDEENSVMVTLTQEETLRFNTYGMVDVQLKALMQDGKVLASDIITIKVDRILNEEILNI